MALIQKPRSLAFVLCDQVLFDHDSRKPMLVGIFSEIRVDRFPCFPPRFDAFAALTDGLGRGTISLLVMQVSTDEEMSVQSAEIEFTDPLVSVNLRFRFRQLSFPDPGAYIFSLLADDEEVAQYRVEISQAEETYS